MILKNFSSTLVYFIEFLKWTPIAQVLYKFERQCVNQFSFLVFRWRTCSCRKKLLKITASICGLCPRRNLLLTGEDHRRTVVRNPPQRADPPREIIVLYLEAKICSIFSSLRSLFFIILVLCYRYLLFILSSDTLQKDFVGLRRYHKLSR